MRRDRVGFLQVPQVLCTRALGRGAPIATPARAGASMRNSDHRSTNLWRRYGTPAGPGSRLRCCGNLATAQIRLDAGVRRLFQPAGGDLILGRCSSPCCDARTAAADHFSATCGSHMKDIISQPSRPFSAPTSAYAGDRGWSTMGFLDTALSCAAWAGDHDAARSVRAAEPPEPTIYLRQRGSSRRQPRGTAWFLLLRAGDGPADQAGAVSIASTRRATNDRQLEAACVALSCQSAQYSSVVGCSRMCATALAPRRTAAPARSWHAAPGAGTAAHRSACAGTPAPGRSPPRRGPASAGIDGIRSR